ncbi:hypothetical protein PoB_001233800 [Plakobranchus ocellatus]|uniref:Uncharacterized protein n=1 Tax=Plakobranchus ocellatus TaxID=259542 RepID=A0AAV3YTH5_9GAST|nr:hypothetical protein PoB_001233800 [Plakobranchus ocellatus]
MIERNKVTKPNTFKLSHWYSTIHIMGRHTGNLAPSHDEFCVAGLPSDLINLTRSRASVFFIMEITDHPSCVLSTTGEPDKVDIQDFHSHKHCSNRVQYRICIFVCS